MRELFSAPEDRSQGVYTLFNGQVRTQCQDGGVYIANATGFAEVIRPEPTQIDEDEEQ